MVVVRVFLDPVLQPHRHAAKELEKLGAAADAARGLGHGLTADARMEAMTILELRRSAAKPCLR